VIRLYFKVTNNKRNSVAYKLPIIWMSRNTDQSQKLGEILYLWNLN